MHQDALLESAPVLWRCSPWHSGGDKTLGKARAEAQLRIQLRPRMRHRSCTRCGRLVVARWSAQNAFVVIIESVRKSRLTGVGQRILAFTNSKGILWPGQ
jgi:hypothetical protein